MIRDVFGDILLIIILFSVCVIASAWYVLYRTRYMWKSHYIEKRLLEQDQLLQQKEQELQIYQKQLEDKHEQLLSFQNEANRYIQLLEQSEERYETFIKHSPDAIILVSGGKITCANQVALDMFQAAAEKELIGKSYILLFHSEDTGWMQLTKKLRKDNVHINECRYVRLNGNVFWGEAASASFIYKGEQARISFIRDITKRKQYEQQLEDAYTSVKERNEKLTVQSKELHLENTQIRMLLQEQAEARKYLETVLESITEAFFVIDAAWRFTYVNKSTLRYTNVSREQLIGEFVWKTFPYLMNARIHSVCKKVMHEKAAAVHEEYFEHESSWYAIHIYPTPMGLALYYHNVTDKKNEEEELQKVNELLRNLSEMDGLTKVKNRRYFDETLEREWKKARHSGKSLSLLLFDIDYFKAYNDTYGHPAGDEVLQAVGRTLSMLSAVAPIISCRYGGEEFAVIMPNTNSSHARHFGELIRRSVEHLNIPHSSSSIHTVVTASVGVATESRLFSKECTALVAAADEALYKAKRNGRNQVVVLNEAAAIK